MITSTTKLCQHYLNILYRNTRGHGVHHRGKSITETYGEILYPSITRLMSAISISNDDIFFDLGSGLGKVVTQIFLTSDIKQAIGIEIIPELHQQAIIAREKIQNDLPDFFTNDRKLTFILGDFLNISFSTATIVLISSPCFSPKILHALEIIINNTPSIHTVLSLRPLLNLKNLNFKKALRIEGSWDAALCYLYRSI